MNDMIKEKVHGAPFLTFLGAWNLLHFFDEQRDSSFGDPPFAELEYCITLFFSWKSDSKSSFDKDDDMCQRGNAAIKQH